MNEKVTIFHPKKTNSKRPWSPYDDNTFVFETYETTTNLELYSIMASHFMLNIPININKPIRTFRRKAQLEPLYNKSVTYIVLDLDKVHSEFSKQKILEYFKDYKCIIGESKSYNGIDNFNLKGVLFTDDINRSDLKQVISALHYDLQEFGEVDEAAIRRATYNAPMLKNKVLFNNEDGIRYKFVKKTTVEHINEVKTQYINTNNNIEINISELNDIEADTMDKLCLKVFQTMGFSATKNNGNGSISFKHGSEKKTPGGFFWFNTSPYTMHHSNSTRTVNIFDTVRKLDAAKELLKKDINYDSEFLEFNTDTKVLTVDEKFLKVDEKIDNTVQDFLSNRNGLLSIRSPMGTGKSTIINHVIQECHEQDMKVLIITNRISVAQDFGKKYNINVYNKDKYEIGDSLVCQFDSLWKYNVKFFDIVIMDEFISLMLHSRSSLNNNSLNITKFFGCFIKKLVIADAFLTGYENFLLNNKKENLHLIDNVYRDPSTLYQYENFNYFVDSISVHASKHKLTVSSTSLSFINSLNMLLTKKGLKVVTLTADTPDSTKNLIYKLFEQEDHDKWDVLIYSPTLTVGVSNLNNVNYHFHYDSSLSTDVISSIQMVKRTRKTKEIHMFIKEKINYLKTSYNDIRDEYMCNIGKNVDNYLFDVDDYGECRLSNTGKKAIKIDTFKNILEFNHKSAMLWLLKYHFRFEPRIVNSTFSSNILTKYQKEVKRNKETLLQNTVNQYLELNDFEKIGIFQDMSADKTLKTLSYIEDEIKQKTDKSLKSKILRLTLEDSQFITKCKYYKCAFNYTKSIWNEEDIKHKISEAVMKNNTNDLTFYNALLYLGQCEIHDEYNKGFINSNKKLKYILDKCGYKFDKQTVFIDAMYRGYRCDKNVKELYNYIR